MVFGVSHAVLHDSYVDRGDLDEQLKTLLGRPMHLALRRVAERSEFAFDLKALWDFGVFAMLVCVCSEQNMLLYLNPDLTGRVNEVSIVWTVTIWQESWLEVHLH